MGLVDWIFVQETESKTKGIILQKSWIQEETNECIEKSHRFFGGFCTNMYEKYDKKGVCTHEKR